MAKWIDLYCLRAARAHRIRTPRGTLTSVEASMTPIASIKEPVIDVRAPVIPMREATRPSPALVAAGMPRVLIVMGVSGCGKSTLAANAAEALGWPLVEGDSLHPPANIAKMSAGVPLNDDDREPWLRDIARIITAWLDTGGHGVVTCSSLKRHYRETISAGHPSVCFLYAKGSFDQIAPRLGRRTGHFMPTSMLESQFAALEEPGDDEIVLEVDVSATADEMSRASIKALYALTEHG
jgi:gluconokinase